MRRSFFGPDDELGLKRVLYPAKVVAAMQACAVHLRDRTPKTLLIETIADDDFVIGELAGLGPGGLGAFADGDHCLLYTSRCV